MIVVDASALANVVVYLDERGDRAAAAMDQDTTWLAPEHWRAETFSAVRGLTLGRKISETQGEAAVRRITQAAVLTVPLTDDLLQRMWQLRGNITGYDAAYVALAEARAVSLITADARLAATASTYCDVKLVS